VKRKLRLYVNNSADGDDNGSSGDDINNVNDNDGDDDQLAPWTE
jgi:hypothetical protein